MSKNILLIGTAFGLTSVMAGAALDHLAPADLSQRVETALHYHQLYAVVVTMLGLNLLVTPMPEQMRRRISAAAILFVAGLVFFCGGLYLAGLTSLQSAVYLAPIGGSAFMAGWAALFLAAFSRSGL